MNAELIIILLLVIAVLIIAIIKIGLISRTISSIQGITGLAAAHPIAACGIVLLFLIVAITNNLNIWSVS